MLCEHPERFLRGARAENLVILLNESRRRRIRDEMSMFANAVDHRSIELESEACRKGDRSEHADGIFLKTFTGIANRPNDAVPQILETADVVDDRERGDVVEERVDRKVAPERVFLRRAERIVVTNQQVGLLGVRLAGGRLFGGRLIFGAGQNVTPERGHLDGIGTEAHVGETKAPPDDPAVPEELLDLVRMRVGADVEIFGATLQQEVTDTTANQIGGVVELLETVQDFQRIRVDVTPGNRVARSRDDHRLSHETHIVPRATIAKMTVPCATRPPPPPEAAMARPRRRARECLPRVKAGRVSALVLTLALSVAGAAHPTAQASRADLAKARAHYNLRQFDEAISAATLARRSAEMADAAGIVLARAHLERYRERADPADLSAARGALGVIRAGSLDARDQVELLLALGESLFLEDDFGAAAEIFESGLDRAAATDPGLADAMLEWWGSAIERQAGALSRDPRVAVFRRLSERTRQELARNPTSAAATYWSVVALRGEGDMERAWDAAVAGWVRARLIGDRAPNLRADLDRLVLQGIVPDRVRHLVQEQRSGAESQLKADWELVKERWK